MKLKWAVLSLRAISFRQPWQLVGLLIFRKLNFDPNQSSSHSMTFYYDNTNRYQRNPFDFVHAIRPDPRGSEHGIDTQSVVFIRVEYKEGVGKRRQASQQDVASG